MITIDKPSSRGRRRVGRVALAIAILAGAVALSLHERDCFPAVLLLGGMVSDGVYAALRRRGRGWWLGPAGLALGTAFGGLFLLGQSALTPHAGPPADLIGAAIVGGLSSYAVFFFAWLRGVLAAA